MLVAVFFSAFTVLLPSSATSLFMALSSSGILQSSSLRNFGYGEMVKKDSISLRKT